MCGEALLGTSTRWPGPAGGGWSKARAAVTRLGTELTGAVSGPPSPANAVDGGERADSLFDDVADRLVDALRLTLENEPDPFGIDTAVRRDARRLTEVLGSLMSEGVSAVVPLEGKTSDERVHEFVRAFSDAVSGEGSGLVADAVTRRASVRGAARLLDAEGSAVAMAVRDGSGSGKISGDLLCLVYAFFFADAISDFLTATVAEKIKLAVPVLYLDPTGEIANRIAKKIVDLVPDPCEEQRKAVGKLRSLAETAKDLIPGSIADLLGGGT